MKIFSSSSSTFIRTIRPIFLQFCHSSILSFYHFLERPIHTYSFSRWFVWNNLHYSSLSLFRCASSLICLFFLHNWSCFIDLSNDSSYYWSFLSHSICCQICITPYSLIHTALLAFDILLLSSCHLN